MGATAGAVGLGACNERIEPSDSRNGGDEVPDSRNGADETPEPRDGADETPEPRNEGGESSDAGAVDIVEAGADNTGSEPINDVLEEVVTDGTRVEFPPGTYLLDRLLSRNDSRDIALVGTEGSEETTLLVEDSFEDDHLFEFGRTSNHPSTGITFEGFTIDFTSPGAGEGVFWAYCRDNARIEDIVVDGYIEGPHPQGFGEILIRLDIVDPDGTGLIKDVVVNDGARYVGSGATFAGIYVGGGTAGRVTVEDCVLTNFHDNGLYTSPAAQSGGTVVIRGGHYSNCDVASVRVGGAETLVEDVTIVQDNIEMAPGNNPRGLYARNGNATIRNVDIYYSEGAAEALQLGVELESFTLENVRVTQTNGRPACWIKESSASGPSFTIDGLNVVTEGDGYPMLIGQGNWDGTIRNSCFQATGGSSRAGLVFESADVDVFDTTVNVAGAVIEGASVSNISYDGICDSLLRRDL